ncbi:hypothetical protein ADUPG1_010615 [Aduncisulcus paluster]|uniref:Uncharacterized protein n=1 Tax=Aduncisulcus paluster TaxID=2918883 RepID=A0ABQ5JS52_9EUKA|nr:hypothetical protein ADUPG1_010615 [Aduncisulcus paluster]
MSSLPSLSLISQLSISIWYIHPTLSFPLSFSFSPSHSSVLRDVVSAIHTTVQSVEDTLRQIHMQGTARYDPSCGQSERTIHQDPSLEDSYSLSKPNIDESKKVLGASSSPLSLECLFIPSSTVLPFEDPSSVPTHSLCFTHIHNCCDICVSVDRAGIDEVRFSADAKDGEGEFLVRMVQTIDMLVNSNNRYEYPGRPVSSLIDGRILIHLHGDTCILPSMTSIESCLPIVLAKEEGSGEPSPEQKAHWESVSKIGKKWREQYPILPAINDIHGIVVAGGDHDRQIDVISGGNGIYVLPMGSNKPILINMFLKGEKISVSTSNMTMVVFSLRSDSRSETSKARKDTYEEEDLYRVFVSDEKVIYVFTLPSCDKLKTLFFADKESEKENSASLDVECVCLEQFDRPKIRPCSISNHLVIEGRISTPRAEFQSLLKRQIDSDFGAATLELAKKSIEISPERCFELSQLRSIPHIVDVSSSNVSDFVVTPLPTLLWFLEMDLTLNGSIDDHSQSFHMFLSYGRTKESFILSFDDVSALLGSNSLPLRECFDVRRHKFLSHVEQWVPDHPWAFSELNEKMMEKVHSHGHAKELKTVYNMKYAPENYCIKIGIVPTEEDKELRFRKDSYEGQGEQMRHSSMKWRAVSTDDSIHVPETARSPDFFEISYFEMNKYLGAPILSFSKWSRTVESGFFSEYSDGIRTSNPLCGVVKEFSSSGFQLADQWCGIPCPTAAAIAKQARGERLTRGKQKLKFKFKDGYLGPSGHVMVGPQPSKTDLNGPNDTNTIILIDPCESLTSYSPIVHEVKPGEWIGSSFTRDGTIGECQIIHKDHIDDNSIDFLPSLVPQYDFPRQRGHTKSSVFEQEAGSPGWHQLHQAVGSDTAYCGFFIKSMFEKKTDYIEVDGLGSEGTLNSLVFELPYGGVDYMAVNGIDATKASVPGGYYTRSGWGDGSYPAFVKRNSDGLCIGIRIIFIPAK